VTGLDRKKTAMQVHAADRLFDFIDFTLPPSQERFKGSSYFSPRRAHSQSGGPPATDDFQQPRRNGSELNPAR
jgi:hypothetical protein